MRHAHENTIERPSRIVMGGKDTGGRIAVIEMLLVRENEPPLHLHTREDEMVYVLSGEIEVALEGDRSRLVPGEAIFLPRGREHAYRLETESAWLLMVSVPAGIEGFYDELGPTLAQDGGYRVERLIALGARYGIEITGPALRDAPPHGETDSRDEG